MATSGDITFNLTALQIISKALKLLTVIGPSDSVTGEDYADCLDLLNGMVKIWQTQGLHLWTKQEASLLLEAGVSEYTLASSSTDHATISSDLFINELGADEAIGQTVLTMDSTSGIIVTDIIGIVLDDNTIHWTTVDAVTDATTLTIDDALPGAAASGNIVYSYTNILKQPIEIKNVRYVYADGTTYVLRPVSRAQFYAISDRDQSSGVPNMVFIDYQADQTIMHLYPTPNEVNDRVEFSVRRIIEDFSNSADDPDLPQYWLQALIYNLAVNIAPMYSKEEKVGGLIAALASQYLAACKDFSQEKTPLIIRPRIDK